MLPFPKSPGYNELSYYKVPEKELEYYKKRNSLFLMIVNGKTGLPALPKDVSKIIYKLYDKKPKAIRYYEKCCII